MDCCGRRKVHVQKNKEWTPYNEDRIDRLHNQTLTKAKSKLSKINVFCCRQPEFGAFNGWVFERTIEFCLRKELKARNIEADFEEGYKLEGRVKVDLAIANVLIEIKLGGIWGKPAFASHVNANEQQIERDYSI